MKKFTNMKKIAAFTMAVMLCAGLLGGEKESVVTTHADENSTKLSQLEEQQKALDDEIALAEQQLKSAKDNAETLKIKYSAVEKQIKAYEKQQTSLELQMAALDEKRTKARKNLEIQNRDIETATKDFMKRIRSMYVAGAANSYSNILINSGDFYDVLMRLELVKRVAEHDNEQLNQLMEKKRKLESTKKEIEEQNKKLKKTIDTYIKKQKELEKKKKQLETLRTQAEAQADNIGKDKSDLENKSQNVKDEKSKLSKKIAEEKAAKAKAAKEKAAKEKAKKKKSAKTTKSTSSKKKPAAASKKPTTTKRPSTSKPKPVTTVKPKPTPKPTPTPSNRSEKIDTVLSYAKSNVGGSYVWGGSSFRATDCSGLVMLSYAKIGISLPHQASAQASYGKEVSYANMLPGDLVFFGSGSYSSIYHVGIYIGNGMMVHAANSNDGIIISNLSSFSQYNSITVIKRII